jgi:hypothetical protein
LSVTFCPVTFCPTYIKILHRSLSLGQKVTLNNFVKHNMGNTFIFFHILKTFNIEFRLVLAISPCSSHC